MNYLAIFIGGGLGSLLRFGLANWLNNGYQNLAYGTIAANILSSLLLGYLIASIDTSNESSKFIYPLLAIGFCGAFSTFSTFSVENYHFLKNGAYFLLFGNILLNLLLCIAAVALSYNIAK